MSLSPPLLPLATPPTRDSRSVHLALAFLIGVAVALLGVRLVGGRFTRPVDFVPQSFANYRVDLNHASVGELRQLPGVGPALADRIVGSRPFESETDIRQVTGIGPSTFARLQPHVTLSPAAVKQPTEPIDPNVATIVELQKLPGIGPKMAQRIIDERGKKPFIAIEDLRRVSGIGVKTLEKLRPHLTFTSHSSAG